MNRSQRLSERITALNEKMYIHSFNRNVHRNPGTTSDPLDFHPAVGAEAATYGNNALVSHIKNEHGNVIKTHVIKKSAKNPNSYEHHTYKFNKSGDSAGSVRQHKVSTHLSQADAIKSANSSSADRLLKRSTKAAKAAIKSTPTKSFAGTVMSSMAKSTLGIK